MRTLKAIGAVVLVCVGALLVVVVFSFYAMGDGFREIWNSDVVPALNRLRR